mgnify:FL=1
MIFETGTMISTDHLPIMDKTVDPFSKEKSFPEGDHIIPLEEMEKRLLLNALSKTDGNKSEAARLLKISRDTLRYKVKKHRLS